MIQIKSREEIGHIQAASLIVAKIIEHLRCIAKPGTSTKRLEEEADRLIAQDNAQSAFKNYRGYPASICTSINEEVVHGIPSDRTLKQGDILSLDVGISYNGYFADAAVTLPIGAIRLQARRLLEVTEKALYLGIEKACEESRLYDISNAIQTYVEKNGFSVVRAFVGHGIGTKMHEEPAIPNFGEAGRGPRLKEGMVLAIEPMVNMGTCDVKILDDKWTAVTADGLPSAHFEHTVAITGTGPRILTRL